MSISITRRSRDEIIKSINNNDLVIDVGGGTASCNRANYIIDILPYGQRNKKTGWGEGIIPRFSEKTWIVRDICNKEPWPFPDKYFDFSICSHTLEDIRDPIWVCSELIRISKAGLIEVPSRLYETSYGIEGRKIAGAAHHRWIIDMEDNTLRFTFKTSWTHLPWIANKESPRGEDRFLRLIWKENFEHKENILNSGKEILFYLKGMSQQKDIDNFYAYLFNYPPLIYRLYKLFKRKIWFQRILHRLRK